MRIVICDDQAAFVESLRRFLMTQDKVDEVVTATSGREALRLVRAGADLLLLDVSLGTEENGLEVLEAIRHQRLPIRVLLLSGRSEWTVVAEALRLGADGYCLKSSEPEVLLLAIDQVMRGQAAVPVTLLRPVMQLLRELDETTNASLDRLGALSARERTVLEMIALGHGRAEIAAALDISINTVRTHLGHLLEKLGVHSQLEAAAVGRTLLAVDAEQKVRSQPARDVAG